jgi:hypothetical protein
MSLGGFLIRIDVPQLGTADFADNIGGDFILLMNDRTHLLPERPINVHHNRKLRICMDSLRGGISSVVLDIRSFKSA